MKKQQHKTTLGQQILDHLGNQTLKSPYHWPIKKARKNRLYDYDHNRYIDFFLNKGNSILGYKPQRLSTLIKNRLSMGYFSHFYHHLIYRAIQSIKDYFKISLSITIDHSILFFASSLERKKFIDQYSIINENLTFEYYKNLNTHTSYSLDLTLSNNYPIYIMFLNKDLMNYDYCFPTEISLLAYQNIISTIDILKSINIKSFTCSLIKPYLKSIDRYGPSFFIVQKKYKDCWNIIYPQLLGYGIIATPAEPIFYICTQTQPNDIQYLFKVLKHLYYQK